MQLVQQAEAKVKPDGGRVLLRYSGTEPKARLLIEGRNANELQYWSTQICDAIRKQVVDVI
jgi:phosphoglucosamine mutase